MSRRSWLFGAAAVIVLAGVAAAVRSDSGTPAIGFVAPDAAADPTTEANGATGRGDTAVIPPLAANGYPKVPVGHALGLLDRLVVDDTDAPVPYDRRRFGPGWADPDGNGCTGRQEALMAWAQPGTLTRGPHCSVQAVTIESLYDGIEVVAASTSEVEQKIQVDHVVPVHDAFRRLCCVTGPDAQRLRELFYNDPENLLPVSAEANQAKSDFLVGDARLHLATPDAACFVADHTVRVKVAYKLPVTAREAGALRSELARCSDPSG